MGAARRAMGRVWLALCLALGLPAASVRGEEAASWEPVAAACGSSLLPALNEVPETRPYLLAVLPDWRGAVNPIDGLRELPATLRAAVWQKVAASLDSIPPAGRAPVAARLHTWCRVDRELTELGLEVGVEILHGLLVQLAPLRELYRPSWQSRGWSEEAVDRDPLLLGMALSSAEISELEGAARAALAALPEPEREAALARLQGMARSLGNAF